uniref:Uncharacterized protein n=1 Tax=uncultured prokaryote TaxID=198431 RepID=A0A0H5Q5K0_9ZZZZ|nr:hypothetical protein [uncultured prokaryote]
MPTGVLPEPCLKEWYDSNVPLYAVQASFPASTSLAADVITNTWHLNSAISPDYDNAVDMIHDFYTATPSDANPVMNYIGGLLLDGKIQYKIYNLADTKPRAPVYEDERSVSFPTASALPPEVALVLSFQAEKVSGTPQARRRNRVYIGPFTASANDDGRPTDALLAAIQSSARDLLAAANASVSWNWFVNSPTYAAIAQVDNGWVDDEWDTQRRRGRLATTRELWTSSTPA